MPNDFGAVLDICPLTRTNHGHKLRLELLATEDVEVEVDAMVKILHPNTYGEYKAHDGLLPVVEVCSCYHATVYEIKQVKW